VTVLPNGVALDRAATPAGGARARLGIPAAAFVVLFLGRMHRIKRLDLLADAFAAVRETHPHAHLVLAGPDEEQLIPDLRRRLTASAASVHVTGAVQGQEKWSLLAEADVVVQCSDSESFGLTVVEALASGVPVIATRTCPWGALEARECGFWVEQTAPAIAHALRRLADDPARGRRMGERGAQFAREQYGWDAIAAQMLRAYTGILGKTAH
jgi:glycosyltransferase involved in cell wall biosynthesis